MRYDDHRHLLADSGSENTDHLFLGCQNTIHLLNHHQTQYRVALGICDAYILYRVFTLAHINNCVVLSIARKAHVNLTKPTKTFM